MSLPVTRRIARAALLVAAGAAPVVAAAGTANAAALPKAPDLGGLTSLDSAGASQTLDDTAQHGVGLVNDLGSKAGEKLAPALLDTGGVAAHKLTPALVETAGAVVQHASPTTQKAADSAEGVVGKTLKDGISTDALAANAAKSLLGGLPLGKAPAGGGLLGG